MRLWKVALKCCSQRRGLLSTHVKYFFLLPPNVARISLASLMVPLPRVSLLIDILDVRWGRISWLWRHLIWRVVCQKQVTRYVVIFNHGSVRRGPKRQAIKWSTAVASDWKGGIHKIRHIVSRRKGTSKGLQLVIWGLGGVLTKSKQLLCLFLFFLLMGLLYSSIACCLQYLTYEKTSECIFFFFFCTKAYSCYTI